MTSTTRDSALVRALAGLTEADLSQVGAKAGRLGLLRRAGLRVPDGFCVTVQAFHESMQAAGLERWWELAVDERARRIAILEGGELPPGLDSDVTRAYEALVERCDGKLLLAVRSSGILEDASTHSFAGVYTSILRVDGPDALRRAIRECWLSALTDEVLGYLERFGYQPETNGMAVLVQEMIEGEVSGVMFTANPATGNPNELCIDAVPGVCEPLVSGDDAEVHLVLDRDPEDQDPSHELLPRAGVARLRQIADEVERRFGGEPQDIEWGIRGDEAFVLQARPVTALPAFFPVDRQLIGEKQFKLAFVGIFSPLGCSLERIKSRVYTEALYRATGRRLQHEQVEINGHLYDSTTDPGATPLWFFKIARDLLATDRVAREFEEGVVPRYLEAIDTAGRRVLVARRPETLVELFDDQVGAYLEFQKHSIAVVNLANVYPRLFKRFCLIRGLTDDGLLALSLVQGEQNETLRRDSIFDSLCEGLREAGVAEMVLAAASWEDARQRLAESDAGREFLERWNAFHGQYGYTWTTGNPKDPGWREEGSLILTSLQAALAHEGEGPSARLARAAQERERTEREMRRRLGRLGRRIFDFLLAHARRHFPVRENRNHLFYRGVAAMRTTLRRLGSVLVSEGQLGNLEEIFFLTYDELRDVLPGKRFEELRQLVDERRRAYARYDRLQPPAVLGGRQAEPKTDEGARPGGRTMSGQPCSPGTVTGRARIVHTPQEMGRLRGGEVLVISKVRPYFATLLGVAGGLVTEEGSLLSHGANLAREYGIPAVLGVNGVTRVIKTGDRVTVDGTNGSVVIDGQAGES